MDVDISKLSAGGVVTVDLGALVDNYRSVGRLAAGSRCAAVVKADAYGLGMRPVSRALFDAGCDAFFVATVAEGRELRDELSQAAIYVLEGPGGFDAVAALRAANLVPVLNSIEQVRIWSNPVRPAACVLHLDTGMSRLGLAPEEVGQLTASDSLLRGLQIEYVMTHLACADEPDNPANDEQLRLFDSLRSALPAAATSIGNSAGIQLGSRFCGDLVRPGIALYGGSPVRGSTSPFREVVGLYGRVLQLRTISRSTPVGYGAAHTAHPPARLATLGLGYADGYPRSLGGRGFAVVAGTRVPVVGAVSMDSVVIDVTAVAPDAIRVDDAVQLLGGGIGLAEVAGLAGTIDYEILTGLSRRLSRRYHGMQSETGPVVGVTGFEPATSTSRR
ncbi:MAG TPA: alanine racemase [Chromatiales bacterium]|nr:alanine racemase [Chromatiales bacterium]